MLECDKLIKQCYESRIVMRPRNELFFWPSTVSWVLRPRNELFFWPLMVDREQWPTRRAFLGADSCVDDLCRVIRYIRCISCIKELRY